MNNFKYNKYLYFPIFSIPILFYYYSSLNYKVWKFIKKYDIFNLLEPIWEIKFNNLMNKQTSNFIKDVIEDVIESDNYDDKYLQLNYNDIYQSGWKPNYNLFEDISKNIINSKKKIIVNCNKDYYPYNNRVKIEFNKNDTDNINLNIIFAD